jgi:tetratricopeptide (TPR) repeat protein
MTSQQQQITAHHRAAQQAIRDGLHRDAHRHCLAILHIDPTFADAWFLCGVIAAHNGETAKSVEILRKVIQIAPSLAEYRAELSRQLIALREPQEALLEARQALALSPQDLPTLNTLGTVLSHCGEHEDALRCYQRAVQLLESRGSRAGALTDDWQADLYFNLAASLQFTGRFAQAKAAYERSIELQPMLFKAHSALSLLEKQTPTNNHLPRLLTLREKAGTARDQLHLGHAIAKEQEDLGLHAESLASLAWGKQAQATAIAYRVASDAALFSRIRQLFTAQYLERHRSQCDSAEPIFIVGMPRTGTTLAEQILAAHSSLYAAGELQNFPLLVKRMTGSESNEVLDIETLNRSQQFDLSALGSAYLESTRPRTGHTPRFIDKLPLNFLYLGLIRAALPNAKLICLRRDPMDTCLSNYRQLFATNFKHYHYNLDLLDCGRYYIEFDRLMRHWREVMPGAVFELRYEALVENPQDTARALLAHCGLPWEEQCLNFHQQPGSVATASAVQVRQPIYASSVDRWRSYGEALQPLYELLRSAGLYD